MKNKFYWMSPKLTVKKTDKYGFGTSTNTDVKKTDKNGMGTFANKDIKKGELLLVFTGYVMSLRDEENLPDGLSDNGMQITEDMTICVSKKTELGGINFFNHSCDPNAGVKGHIFLVSMRKINRGEEVTLDYAMALYKSKNAEPYRLKCLCGKKNCREIITDNDWKIKELQDRYDGYFQYFIQEKINKIKNKKK